MTRSTCLLLATSVLAAASFGAVANLSASGSASCPTVVPQNVHLQQPPIVLENDVCTYYPYVAKWWSGLRDVIRHASHLPPNLQAEVAPQLQAAKQALAAWNAAHRAVVNNPTNKQLGDADSRAGSQFQEVYVKAGAAVAAEWSKVRQIPNHANQFPEITEADRCESEYDQANAVYAGLKVVVGANNADATHQHDLKNAATSPSCLAAARQAQADQFNSGQAQQPQGTQGNPNQGGITDAFNSSGGPGNAPNLDPRKGRLTGQVAEFNMPTFLAPIQQYWTQQLPAFHPPKVKDLSFTGFLEYNLGNKTIFYDSERLNEYVQKYGEFGAEIALAHEMAHHVQVLAGTHDKFKSTFDREQNADRLAGAYIKWAAQRGIVKPGDFRSAVNTLKNAGDKAFASDGHGTAEQRVQALLEGYNNGTGL